MLRYIFYTAMIGIIAMVLFGCEQTADDPDNAIVSGYVYRHVAYTDSVFVDTAWIYTDWYFYDPIESVQVWVESDITSKVPYTGPDIMGYTDSLGRFEIPVYLGHRPIKDYSGFVTGYEYVYYADVRVWCAYKGTLLHDFGGGITLEAGKRFELYPVCMEWLTK